MDAARIVVRRSQDVFDLLGPGLAGATEDMALAGYLARDGTLLALSRVTRRGSDWPVEPILRDAVERGAAQVVLAHNRASGEPLPTPAEIEASGDLSVCAAARGLTLFDHIIVGRDGWASLRTFGLL